MMVIPPITRPGRCRGLVGVDIRVAVGGHAVVADVVVRIDGGDCVVVGVTIDRIVVISMASEFTHHPPSCSGGRVAVMKSTIVHPTSRIVVPIIRPPIPSICMSIIMMPGIPLHIPIDFISHNPRPTMPSRRPLIEPHRIASKPMRSIKRRTAIRLLEAPAGLPREDRRLEAPSPRCASAVGKRRVSRQRDVVEAEVPHGGVHHSVRGDGEDGADDRAGEAVVPVMKFVNCQRASDQACRQYGSVHGYELPEGGMVVTEDLEFRIQVEVQIQKSRERSCAVARWHALEGVVDFVAVTAADAAVEHQSLESRADDGWVGVADGEEVWAQTADEPFDEDLEDGGADDGVKQTDNSVVGVPEGADADLHAENDEDRDEGSEKSSRPDGDDVVAKGVGKFRVHNIAVAKGNGEGARRSWMGFVDTEANGAHDHKCEKVDPSEFQPLPEGGASVVVPAVNVEQSAFLAFLLAVGHVLVGAVSTAATLGAVSLFMAHHAGEEAAASFSVVSAFAVVVAVIVTVVSSDRVGCGAIVAELAVAVDGLIVVSNAMVAVVPECVVLT